MDYGHEWWRKKYAGENEEYLWRPYEDFRVFLTLVWRHLNLPPPTAIQLDMARCLQIGGRREIYEAFRGVGKSWITSAFVIWLLLRDPQLNILVVSASKERSDNFTTFTQRLITEIAMLQHLLPRTGQRDSKVAFDVGPAEADHAPSVKSVGITGQLTGSRANVIVADDIEAPGNSATQTQRDKLAELVKEFDAILKTTSDARIIYLGTPQTEFSVYNALPERGYKAMIWPTRYPSPKQRAGYGNKLAPYIADALDANPALTGKPTDPMRFGDMDLLERELSYGRSGFALQFMLDTSLSDVDRYPLKLNDLMVLDMDYERGPEKCIWSGGAEHVLSDVPCIGMNGDRYHRPMDFERDINRNILTLKYTGCVMAIDPSGRGKDETAIAITKMLNSQIYVAHSAGFRDGYSDKTLTAIATAAKLHSVKEIIIESNFGDGMFASLLKPYLHRIYPCTILEERSTGQKELRIIDVLEPVMNQHRLVVDKKLIDSDYRTAADAGEDTRMTYQLFYQMTRITRERGALRRDDRLDALAIAVKYWVEHMAKDQDEALQENKDKLLDQVLTDFQEHVFGYKPVTQTWV